MRELLHAFKQFLLRLIQPRPPRLPPPAPIVLPVRASEESAGRSKQELFYEIMAQRLEAQSRADDALAQKTATWLTIPTLVLTFLATILVVERESMTRNDFAVVLIAFVLYITSLSFLFRAYQPKTWLAGPFWQEIAMVVGDPAQTIDDMYYDIGFFIGNSTLNQNDKVLKGKQRLLTTGVIIGLVSVVLILAVVVLNLSRTSTTKEPTRVILVTPIPEPTPGS